MGLHTEEHHLLLNQLTAAEANADVVYREFHNGDTRINDMVMNNRDDVREAKSMLAAHIRATSGDDAKLVNYDKYHKWILAGGSVLVASIVKHAYDIALMMQ